MSKNPQRPKTPRKMWETPRVDRLIAVDAENLYSPSNKDGIYSTS